MSEAARDAWNALGWTETRWQADMAPASEGKDWDQLTTEERNAAQTLGATETFWDNNDC